MTDIPLVERFSCATIPTEYGDFLAIAYHSKENNLEHLALVYGELAACEPILTRVHSECLTGDVFKSKRCDCGEQLQKAMELISKNGSGVIVYLRGHEGRGIGLKHKLKAYNLQDQGCDTVEANHKLGFEADLREYKIAAEILKDLKVKKIELLTNNPLKYDSLIKLGLEISQRIPLITPLNTKNSDYLRAKQDKLGHFLKVD